MMDENKLLLASLTDKYERFLQYEYLIVSDFLNLSQQSAVSGLLKRWRAEGTRWRSSRCGAAHGGFRAVVYGYFG